MLSFHSSSLHHVTFIIRVFASSDPFGRLRDPSWTTAKRARRSKSTDRTMTRLASGMLETVTRSDGGEARGRLVLAAGLCATTDMDWWGLGYDADPRRGAAPALALVTGRPLAPLPSPTEAYPWSTESALRRMAMLSAGGEATVLLPLLLLLLWAGLGGQKSVLSCRGGW